MENTPRLSSELVALVGQPSQWRAVRHLYPLGWMGVGLMQSGDVSLTAGIPFVRGRARYAQSSQRRFARWRQNPRVEVQALSAPLIQQAVAEWGKYTVDLALDTTLLWNRYGIVRLSVIDRGRAGPLVWQVLEQGSSRVAYEAYEALLDAVPLLLPHGVKVVFLADRGFADTHL